MDEDPASCKRWISRSNATPWPYELSHVKNEFSLVGLTVCQYMRMVRVREKVFRNSSGFRKSQGVAFNKAMTLPPHGLNRRDELL